MKKYLIFGISALFFNIFVSFGQQDVLRFNANGEFKIVQFTDLHLKTGFTEVVFNLVNEIIELEKPDLVIVTGDITMQDSVENLIQQLGAIFAKTKTFWATVYGNHDEHLISRKNLTEIYHSLPYNLNSFIEGIKGESNYILPLAGKENTTKALLYMFDSNTYNSMLGNVKGTYGWIEFSQIEWYRKQSAAFTEKNNGTPLPALAFFHIPFEEYDHLWKNDSSACIGSKNEAVCFPALNTGLFASMAECGDVMGTMVGHDHVNDYIGSYNDIALAYGRFSGTKNTYGNLIAGARVLVLQEDKREFTTWIREKGGNIVYDCQYKECLVKAMP